MLKEFGAMDFALSCGLPNENVERREVRAPSEKAA